MVNIWKVLNKTVLPNFLDNFYHNMQYNLGFDQHISFYDCILSCPKTGQPAVFVLNEC